MWSWSLINSIIGACAVCAIALPARSFTTPPAVYNYTDACRQKFFREVFKQFWQCLETMPDRSRHQTTAVWRWVMESWLRRQVWITVKEKLQPIVSANSQPFFSQC
jgi:hypothetical protein